MARRNPHPNDVPRPTRGGESATRPGTAALLHPPAEQPAAELFFPGLSEFCRRAALGLVALLFVTRAYYPSEDAETGTGLVWILLLLLASGIAIVANLVAGVTRVRWSWVDAAVFTLILLVGWSAGHAADRRAAITMAWEWGGMGLLYGLVRSLPRSRAESSALALVVIATAVAVATYGLYQVAGEFPVIRHQFVTNPVGVLTGLGITPGTPSAESFKQRLLYSNEPFSTFALANSLAGFIVGPLVLLIAIGFENLKRQSDSRKWWSLAFAIGPSLILIICLLLSKSRSAYAGGLFGLAVLAWSSRAAVSRRWLVGSGLAFGVLITALIIAGVVSRQLDVQILTEAKKSLGYRWEYWVGSWGIITDSPSPYATNLGSNVLAGSQAEGPTSRSRNPFWWGVGPANFAGPYLKHKLPQASEEIQDPHNAILEVWAESGLFAMLALVVGIGGGAFEILRSNRGSLTSSIDEADQPATVGGGFVPVGTGWLVALGGLGWFGVWALGSLNPVTQKDLTVRWLVLGASWITTILLVGPLVARRGVPAVGLGAAFLAVALELQASGGIGIPTVALSFWILLAIGLNLRDDAASGRVRELPGLGAGVGLACGWAVMAGTFYGAVVPGWRSDLDLADGQALLASQPPRYEPARAALLEAIQSDRYSVRPWLVLAELEYRFWKSPEAGERRKTWWTNVLLALDKAMEGEYRDPDNLNLRRRQASYARLILKQLPEDAKPFDLVGLKSTIVKATRQAVRLYPTSASLRAELAEASAELGMYGDAVTEARAALQLDELMPHQDKKLPVEIRTYLLAQLPTWSEQARTPIPTTLNR